VAPTYTAIHHILTNPVYAGAYAYGKSRCERYVDERGAVKKRMRHLPMEQWSVLIRGHHDGFIAWETFEANRKRLHSNTRPGPHREGGIVREGSALLQGIGVCGHCGRRLSTHYRGRNSTPGYHCAGKDIVEGRGLYCLNVGGVAIDEAVANAFLEAVTPAALEAMNRAVEQARGDHEAALAQWRLEIERLRYEAGKAERRYRAVEPENRLVARGLETEWESRLRELAGAEAALRRGELQRPATISAEQLRRLQALSADLGQLWRAATTTDRDRKELLRTILEEVVLNLKRAEGQAHLTLRWRGGAITTLDVPVPRFRPQGPRTAEDTLSLLRRLAALYPDEVIAGILNRQGRQTASGERFTANHVGNLRRYRGIPRFQAPAEPPSGELVSIRKAAQILGMNTSSIHRWLADGFIAGEQVTPGAPWQIRITDELRARLVAQAPPEFVPMLEATRKLGVSRQTVLQRVKRGELEAVLVRQGRRKGLRIKVAEQPPPLFHQFS
jgi:predicted DNA-binding transcriptional regulator AlpA